MNIMKNKLNEFNDSTKKGKRYTDGWKEIPKEKFYSDKDFYAITDEIYLKMTEEEQDTYRTDWYLRNRRDVNSIGRRMMEDAEKVQKNQIEMEDMNG